MYRKIFSTFVACLVMICLLPSCSFLLIKDSPNSADKKSLNNNTQDVDYIILDSKFLNFFRKNDEGDQLELVKRLDREDTDIRYWTEFFRKSGDIYAVRSSVSSKNDLVSLVTIDSATLSVKRFELSDFTDIFSLCIDDNYVYISTPFAYDKIVFQRFDFRLNNKKRFEYINKDAVLFPIAMQSIGDYIYVLTGMSGFESKPNNYVENHLLKFDKDFTLLQDIDLQFNNGGYVGMAYDGDKKLYITKASEGLANGEALPSNEIICFDVEAEHEVKRYYLSESFPRLVRFDEESNTLLIMKDYNQPGDSTFTILSLENGEEHIISLEADHFQATQPNPPYFWVENGVCYFLLSDKIIIYDIAEQEMVDLSFAKYDLEHPNFLIVK